MTQEISVDDNDKTHEESPYSNKYTEEEFNEVLKPKSTIQLLGITFEPTLERMWTGS